MPRTSEGPADFCRSLDWTVPIEWFGTIGYTPLDASRRVKLQLSNAAGRGTSYGGQYNGFVVTMLDIHGGTIDRTSFAFDDYLHERSDERGDYPLGSNPCFVVLDHVGWRWYIAIPASTRPFTAAVERYLDQFRTAPPDDAVSG